MIGILVIPPTTITSSISETVKLHASNVSSTLFIESNNRS
uniref:Uncharacterized protein n=1 Tax=viral metagenome TaxID=1070528 RepID=A0A6C0EC67_9ZZZZ